MKNLCHSKVCLLVLTTIIKEDATSTPIIHGKGARYMIMMKKDLGESI